MAELNGSSFHAGGASASPALRYVVLYHDGIPDPHYDLMFEMEPGALLTTWRSPVWPIANRVRLAPLSPHRRDYLEYEGPVSGNRGYVTRAACGTFRQRKPESQTWELLLEGSAVEGLLIRSWRDTCGSELWDAAGM